MNVGHGLVSVPDDAMPALRRGLLTPLNLERLEPAQRADHPPRILLLYGSLRERSFSRLLTEEAAQLLRVLGAEPRVFGPVRPADGEQHQPRPSQGAGAARPVAVE